MDIITRLEATRDRTLAHFDRSAEQLAQSYAPGKWPVRYLLHHLADAKTCCSTESAGSSVNPGKCFGRSIRMRGLYGKDPQFVEKVRDIVGLYLNPPQRAMVLCVDEKSRVQALNRTQPILPRAAGVPARQSHDSERHGVTSLFAALEVASGVAISSGYRRHRHPEFLRFLEQVEASLPRGLEVHLVMDNYGTHKVKKVRAWLARHPRYHVHFTPTAASWLNLVERLFAEVTQRCVGRGSYMAVRELEKAMRAYLDQRNRDPKPFVWTADADLILGKVGRLCERISDSGH